MKLTLRLSGWRRYQDSAEGRIQRSIEGEPTLRRSLEQDAREAKPA